VAKLPDGFVALASLRRGNPDPASALAEIRRIYFETTRQTIDADFAHAIELLKTLPTEDERERATVFMDGLNEMRREWEKASPGAKPGRAQPGGAKASSTKGAGARPAKGKPTSARPGKAGPARSRPGAKAPGTARRPTKTRG
jgi:hypothetical protein